MSQKRVITGSDDRGRPISRWEEPEPVPTGYGFMEPAFTGTIERRQATPDELAAARARETPEPVRLSGERAMWTPFDVAALKERTGAVTGEDTIRAMNEASEPPERTEEGPVAEDLTPDSDASEAEAPSGPLWALSLAAREADVAWLSLQLAELTWDVSRAALAAAMAECATIMTPEPGGDLSPAAGVTEPDVEPKPLRQPGRHRSSATETTDKEERAQRVTEAVARHGGDRAAAAAELGMRPNAVAMVLKFADRRAGAPA